MSYLRLVRLSSIDGDELPTEFRIFAAGVNESSKGPALFDEFAARSVMAAYERDGIDLMLDLEHESLKGGRTDAMCWYQLALRAGELWAVNVRWTPEGEDRLRTKRQRYVSPAFDTVATARMRGVVVDGPDEMVVCLVNCALTSLPATYHAPALVAASKGYTTDRRSKSMNVEIIKKALDAIVAGDAEAAMGILTELIASAASGEEAEMPTEPEALADPPADETEDEEPEEMSDAPEPAAVQLSGAPTADEIATWRASHIELEKRTAALEADRKRIEDADRAKLVGELIRLSAETPATARSNGKLVSRLANEPIAEMRSRVSVLAKAKAAAPSAPRAPIGPEGLSDRALQTYNRLPDESAKARFLATHRKMNSNSEARA